MISVIHTVLKKKEFWIVFLLLAIAAFMRLYRIDEYMTFLGDEGRDVLVVKHILDGKLTLLGPTASVGGFFFGPIYYYMMAPFLFLFRLDPVGPAIMVAIIGTLTVGLVYIFGKEFFNKKAAFIAALLYAIAPAILQYSHSSWNPNPVPFFAVLSTYSIFKALEKKSIKLFFVGGLLLGIAIQLHFIVLFLAAIIYLYFYLANNYPKPGLRHGALLLVNNTSLFIGILSIILVIINLIFPLRIISSGVLFGIFIKVFPVCLLLVLGTSFLLKKRSSVSHLFKENLVIIKELFFVACGFLVGWSPYLAFEFRHGFPNTQNIFKFIFNSPDVGGKGNFLATIFDVFSKIFSRLVFNYPIQNNYHFYSDFVLFIWLWIATIVGVLAVGYFLYQTQKTFHKNDLQFRRNLLITLWFFSFLFFGFYKKNIYDYYFGFMFPLPFLLVGNLIVRAIEKPKSLMNLIFSGLLMFAFVINITGMPFINPGNHQLNQAEIIARFVYEKTGSKPYNFAIITGGNSDHTYRYFFELWGKPPVIIEYPGIDPNRKTVTDQLFVVCESLPCQPIGNSLWEVAGFGQAEIANEWDVSVFKVYKLVHYKEGLSNACSPGKKC